MSCLPSGRVSNQHRQQTLRVEVLDVNLPRRMVAQVFVSLIVLVKLGHIASLSVPDHREIARGTLRGLLRSADIELSEFLRAAG
ncbi:MAG: hypothetical protein ABI584_02660 [Acidobacteriota bacterium]